MFIFQKQTSGWRIVFFLTAAFYLIGAITFPIFGSASVQSWNDSPVMESKKNSKIYTIHEVPKISHSAKDIIMIKEEDEKVER